MLHLDLFMLNISRQVAIKMVKRTAKSRLHDSVFQREVSERASVHRVFDYPSYCTSGECAQAAVTQQSAAAGVYLPRR